MITNRIKKCNGIDDDPCIITIHGEPASKANSRRFVLIGGKPRFIKSKKALFILKLLTYSVYLEKRCLKKT